MDLFFVLRIPRPGRVRHFFFHSFFFFFSFEDLPSSYSHNNMEEIIDFVVGVLFCKPELKYQLGAVAFWGLLWFFSLPLLAVLFRKTVVDPHPRKKQWIKLNQDMLKKSFMISLSFDATYYFACDFAAIMFQHFGNFPLIFSYPPFLPPLTFLFFFYIQSEVFFVSLLFSPLLGESLSSLPKSPQPWPVMELFVKLGGRSKILSIVSTKLLFKERKVEK